MLEIGIGWRFGGSENNVARTVPVNYEAVKILFEKCRDQVFFCFTRGGRAPGRGINVLFYFQQCL